jgi:hypothetical protein
LNATTKEDEEEEENESLKVSWHQGICIQLGSSIRSVSCSVERIFIEILINKSPAMKWLSCFMSCRCCYCFLVVVLSSSLTCFFFSSIFPKYFIIPIISGLTSFIPASKNKNDDVHPSPQNNKTQLLH